MLSTAQTAPCLCAVLPAALPPPPPAAAPLLPLLLTSPRGGPPPPRRSTRPPRRRRTCTQAPGGCTQPPLTAPQTGSPATTCQTKNHSRALSAGSSTQKSSVTPCLVRCADSQARRARRAQLRERAGVSAERTTTRSFALSGTALCTSSRNAGFATIWPPGPGVRRKNGAGRRCEG